ncbi:MAG: hypothetical protein ACTSW4_01875 [Candidatus Ranarchaeia archaeon]
MEYRELLNRGVTLVLDPAVTDETANEFFAKYGGYLNELAIVAKHPSGYVFYNSSIAHAHPDYRTFFSSHIKLGVEVGIRTYAIVNTLLDKTFGRDPQYQTVGAQNKPAPWYVCPMKNAFWDYIAALAKEMARYKPTGIVFTGNRFARREYCLCPDCRRAFSKHADIRLQFSIDEVLADPELKAKWFDWRSSILVNGFKKVIEKVWDVDKDLDLAVTVDLEPEIGLDTGAYEVFGQNYLELAELTGHSLIHILPFSPILPEIGSPEYQQVIDAAKFTEKILEKEYFQSIFYWGPIEEQEYDFVKKISEDLQANRIFVYPAYPLEYNDIRESHLGFY